MQLMMYHIVHTVESCLTPSTSMAKGHDSPSFHQIRTSNITCLVKPTVSAYCEPDNSGSQQTEPHLVNATPCFHRFIFVARGHSPPHCETTQILREAITGRNTVHHEAYGLQGKWERILTKIYSGWYKIQETLFNVGYSKTVNISYMSFFPTNMYKKTAVKEWPLYHI